MGWRATKHEKIQLSSQQELLSPCNLQLISSFVFNQRIMCDLFVQMHKHSNAELVQSLMLEETLYHFDISPSPTTERFATAVRLYSQGEHLFTSFFFFFTLFLINKIQGKWSLSLLAHNVSLAIKMKVD